MLPQAGAQTQAMLNKTALHEFARTALEMQKAVDELRRKMSAERRRNFDQSQRYWVKYRDATCRFETSGATGPAQPMAKTNCRNEMTRERLAALRKLADCPEEGAPACTLRR